MERQEVEVYQMHTQRPNKKAKTVCFWQAKKQCKVVCTKHKYAMKGLFGRKLKYPCTFVNREDKCPEMEPVPKELSEFFRW